MYWAGERYASDSYWAGEKYASDSYWAGERYASDSYWAGLGSAGHPEQDSSSSTGESTFSSCAGGKGSRVMSARGGEMCVRFVLGGGGERLQHLALRERRPPEARRLRGARRARVSGEAPAVALRGA